jgi:hypothetical protein
MKYRILQNTLTGKYKVQVKTLLFFWSTLQMRLDGLPGMMYDAQFNSYEEAEAAYKEKYSVVNKPKWKDVTKPPKTAGDYQCGGFKGKQDTPPNLQGKVQIVFNTKQEEIIDRLMDGTQANIEELSQKTFNELIECNNTEMIKLSSYKLADMWNSSDAVRFHLIGGKTASDFHSNENWEN